MINASKNSSQRDRYWFKDYQEITKPQSNIVSPTHSLCIGCSDYYDIPPCQANFTTDSGCFPSLISPDRN